MRAPVNPWLSGVKRRRCLPVATSKRAALGWAWGAMVALLRSTNIREPHQPPARKSRGELVRGSSAVHCPLTTYLADVIGRIVEYAGFNLLVGTRDELWHFNANHTEPTQLKAGVYGLSNAGLDTPWPNCLRPKLR